MLHSPSSSDLNRHRKLLEGFAENHLRPYLIRLTTLSRARALKVFNDPVWGSIVLYPFEVVLLDSPLLQRLRRVRQLGVAHWVYPGANHSRLEHAIGTVHQIERLIVAINTPPNEFIDAKMARLLRVAALCHDIGHGVMSHVSENAMKDVETCLSLRIAFADSFDLDPENVQLSEMAGYYLIGSPSFKELLQLAMNLYSDHALPSNPAELIQKAIISQPISDSVPLLHELVAGPFDADKLDYMPRDAHMSGVPVVTDVPRLIRKTRAVQLPQADLPREIGAKVKGGNPNYTLIGIDLSGGRTLDELMLGRVLLFDKIYRHQKVRAIEGMVTALLHNVADLVAETISLTPYAFTDEELLDIDKPKIKKLAGRKLTADEDARVDIAVDLARRLKVRNLFVRCFAFAQCMPLDAYRKDSDQRLGIEKLLRDVDDFTERKALVGKIAKQIRDMICRLGQQSTMVNVLVHHIESYICISPPEPPMQTIEVSRAYLITYDNKVVPFSVESAESMGWADSYLLARDVGYVFAPEELSPFVYLATETVVFRDYGIHIPNTMLAYAKQSVDALDKLRKQLAQVGYYKSLPYELHPLPSRLTMADVASRLEGIVTRLSGYCGPISEQKPLDSGTLNPDRVKDWIRQFQGEEMVDAALRLVECVRLIGRKDIVKTLDGFMQQHPEFQSGHLCLWGLPKDSSAQATYYAGDITSKCGLSITSLSDALAGDKPIVFLDDFIGTGHQAISIIENWLGLPPSFDLGEDRGGPLTEEQRGRLRGRPVAVVFSAGWSDGAELLKKTMTKHDLKAIVHIGIGDEELPRAFGCNLFKSPTQEAQFLELCKNMGNSLLLNPSLGHDSNWAEERSLGYGNRANLVVFPYNTPAQTLTCLWADGSFNGIPWTSLFPRRKKR